MYTVVVIAFIIALFLFTNSQLNLSLLRVFVLSQFSTCMQIRLVLSPNRAGIGIAPVGINRIQLAAIIILKMVVKFIGGIGIMKMKMVTSV